MLRDYLKLDAEDRLIEQDKQAARQDREATTRWQIVNSQGLVKGSVMLSDRFTTRRSWNVNYRITQTDASGRVVIDRLTDVL
ncbi:hypothetical protein [Pantoea sp. UBA4549]|uniref:hypothetical protein n=1 Tax=Pantoea sp. UBA4549 TaxID=1947033 RepID=UPI0025E5CCB2|nr:hypothetical protein [Pantoea sp. UBA4549]